MELNSFETIPTIRYKNLEHNYWYEHMGEDILYLRINSCFEETGKPVEEFTSQLVDDIKKLPEQAKVVIDFRGNIGGYPFFFDWEKVANSLNERKNLNTYILIDEGCYSAGVIVPYSVKQLIKNSVLAGTSAGQNPNMCGSTREYVLPNSKYTVAISNYYTEFWPDYEYETLLPDITIYQTLEDYKQGIDTVLEAIKGME